MGCLPVRISVSDRTCAGLLCLALIVALACSPSQEPDGASQPVPRGDPQLTAATPASPSPEATPDSSPPTAARPPGKLAVIVAIGHYPEPMVNGYRRINAVNDIGLIETALRAQGFQPSDIRIVLNDQADRAGIWRALDDLLARAIPGDAVVIHYSGHGDQLTDDNGDEIDGYDEVLVPFGAPAGSYFKRRYGAAYAAQAAAYARDLAGFKHVRDDELNGYLARLRAQVGPGGSVMISIDACHSGTGTRGDLGPMPRGNTEPIGAPADGAGRADALPDHGGVFEASSRERQGTLAPFVAFSASRQGELDYETKAEDGRPVGPLSLALSRTLPGLRRGDTYQTLFDRVAELMSSFAPNQLPQLEGYGHAAAFGGRAAPYRPYYRVLDVQGPRELRLAGGLATGLVPGSRVAFYPAGRGAAESGSPALAQGTVTAAEPLRATVALDLRDGPDVDLREARASVTEAAFGQLAVAVAFDRTVAEDARNAITADLTSEEIATVAPSAGGADLVIAPAPGAAPAALVVQTAADRIAIGDPIALADIDQVVERVRRFAQSRYLKRIAMRHPEIDVRLELVPVTHAEVAEPVSPRFPEGRRCVPGQSDASRPGHAVLLADAARTWQLTDGDGYLLRLENRGSRPAHVAVLKLYPDAWIGQQYPMPEQRQADLRLAPGASYLVIEPCFVAGPPWGNYVLKLFATDATDPRSRPMDFDPILTRERSGADGGGPFEQLLASASRTRQARMATGLGSTDAIFVRVVPRLND